MSVKIIKMLYELVKNQGDKKLDDFSCLLCNKQEMTAYLTEKAL